MVCMTETYQAYDTYGRPSNFYVEIETFKIPIFHPGTLAMDSAVKKGSILSLSNNSNGVVLSVEDCCFLAKFVTLVAREYRKIKIQKKGQKNAMKKKVLKPKILIKALEKVLNELKNADKSTFRRICEYEKVFLKLLYKDEDYFDEVTPKLLSLFRGIESDLYHELYKKWPDYDES